jgi:hypothetical protein
LNLPSGLNCQRIDATLGEVKAIDTILHIDMCVCGNPHGAESIGMVAAGDAKKAKTAVKKASKSVGATAGTRQRKGPQPAKYADPKSGATWSGRGPAPAWLAGAKDRTKFLIDGGSGVADSAAASKPKAVTKKPATKTAVAKKAPAKKSVSAKKVATKASVAAAPEAVTVQPTA